MSYEFTKIKVKGENGYGEDIPIGANAINIKYNNETVKSALDRIKDITGRWETDGAGMHNSHYRGKYLGSTITETQINAINEGSFNDLYIGDYWTLPVTKHDNTEVSVNFRIAHFDYFYGRGDTKCTTHHIVLVPDQVIYSDSMNSNNNVTGAYVGSLMKTEKMDNTITAFENALTAASSNSVSVLTYREYFQNAVTNGKPSGGAWFDAGIELMNEAMIAGGGRLMEKIDNSINNVNIYALAQEQLKLFDYDITKIMAIDTNNNRVSYWLRNVTSGISFSDVGSYGSIYDATASNIAGIRPYIPICKNIS